MQLFKGLRPTQRSGQGAQLAEQGGIGFLFVRRQLLICSLQYSVRKVSRF